MGNKINMPNFLDLKIIDKWKDNETSYFCSWIAFYFLFTNPLTFCCSFLRKATFQNVFLSTVVVLSKYLSPLTKQPLDCYRKWQSHVISSKKIMILQMSLHLVSCGHILILTIILLRSSKFPHNFKKVSTSSITLVLAFFFVIDAKKSLARFCFFSGLGSEIDEHVPSLNSSEL